MYGMEMSVSRLFVCHTHLYRTIHILKLSKPLEIVAREKKREQSDSLLFFKAISRDVSRCALKTAVAIANGERSSIRSSISQKCYDFIRMEER